MPDHIDFLAFFAIHTAKAMGIPCTQHAIHLPTIWKKWNVIKSPFIFAKTKEIFEEKVYRRVIQLFDADDVAVEEWANYLVSRLPDGVDAKVDKYEWTRLLDACSTGRAETDDSIMEDGRLDGKEGSAATAGTFEARVQAEMEMLLAQYEASKSAPRSAGPAASATGSQRAATPASSPSNPLAKATPSEKKVSAKRLSALAEKETQRATAGDAAGGKTKK